MLFISRIRLKNFKSFKILNAEIPSTFLCLAGPNGSGKCVDGDSEVSLSDGTAVSIRHLVDNALKKGHVDKIDDGYIAQYDAPIEILSLDPKTLKISKKRISAFVKRKAPKKMLKVTSRSGKEIIATEYHPFFVLNKEGSIQPIKADQLKKGIRVAIPRTMPVKVDDAISWNEITDIQEIKPREEWVYDLTISDTHNFIAQGFIVHNSNITDGIRFALGETSLKSLRARSVKDLIHTGARTAEVTLNFDGDAKIEIKRVIREDGKILYRLDGKRTTRRSILEVMKKYNLDESGRNVTAQGEVQRLLNMSGKERRMIIDSVAGIADFELKKKEAMRELETVEGRIKDAHLVLGERNAFLGELEREREVAIKYTDARDKHKNSKGTLLQKELEKLEKESENLQNLEEKIDFNKTAKEQEFQEINEHIADVEHKRSTLSEELQNKQKTSGFIRKIEELKAAIGSKTQFIEDKEGTLEKMGSETNSLAKELENEKEQLNSLQDEITTLQDELKNAESSARKQGTLPTNQKTDAIRKELSEAETVSQELKEQLISLQAEISSKKEIIESKKQELERITESQGIQSTASDDDLESLVQEVDKLTKSIDNSFQRTKEINSEIAELDKKLLELKEKASIFKVRSSPHLANPALQLVGELKKKDGNSIFGTIADLIQFDSKHAHAVEAAAGGRLLYVVVDNVDTATSVITRLKKTKSGRATFVPVNGVRVSKPVKMNGFSSILDAIDFPEHIRNAIQYVFADTLLVDSVADAKKIGIGTIRMVTLDGEIFERSGIISGGRNASSILMGNQLRKIELELDNVKSNKDSLIQELYSLRDEESEMRSRKSQLEVKLKSLELEQRAVEEKEQANKEIRKRKEELISNISSLEQTIQLKVSGIEDVKSRLATEQTKLDSLRESLSKEEELFKAENEESSKRREEIVAKLSSLRATVDGKLRMQEMQKSDLREKEERLKQIKLERKDVLEKITETKRTLAAEQTELSEFEEKIATVSKQIEKLFEQMKSFEAELQELGKQRGEKRIELDRLSKDYNQLSIRKATNSTRLEDVRAEFSSYGDFQVLEQTSEDELKRDIAECERILAGLGNVNMAAIDMYEKKKAEIDDIKTKIDKLSEERQAIFQMMSEIEEHKKEAFFETFYAVSDNFKKMFDYVHIGEGYLYLDKPNEPFESGLHIKIKRNNHEHSLNSLSGGETTLVALMFIFALQFYKPSPFYILDEVDAALDKPNSKNLADIVRNIAKDSQMVMVSHNDNIMANAETVLGVAKVGTTSKLVGVKLKQAMENRNV